MGITDRQRLPRADRGRPSGVLELVQERNNEAEYIAHAAIEALEVTGAIDHVHFGAVCDRGEFRFGGPWPFQRAGVVLDFEDGGTMRVVG